MCTFIIIVLAVEISYITSVEKMELVVEYEQPCASSVELCECVYMYIGEICISTIWQETFEVENFRRSVRSEHFAGKTFTEY